MILRTRAFLLLLLSSEVASALFVTKQISKTETGLHVSAAREGVFMLTRAFSLDELCLAVENGLIDSVGTHIVQRYAS